MIQLTTCDFYTNDNYFLPAQWMSYRWQVCNILKLQPSSVLEIGKGNGIVSTMLKNLGLNVVTADINEQLTPDYVIDITNLKSVFGLNSYQCILCAQVLEHIPYEKFEQCVKNIYDIVSQNALITLPQAGRRIYFCGHVPKFSFDFNLRIPSGRIWEGHYWEMDYKKYCSKTNIIKTFEKYFSIIDQGNIEGNPYHYFFVLQKRGRV